MCVSVFFGTRKNTTTTKYETWRDFRQLIPRIKIDYRFYGDTHSIIYQCHPYGFPKSIFNAYKKILTFSYTVKYQRNKYKEYSYTFVIQVYMESFQYKVKTSMAKPEINKNIIFVFSFRKTSLNFLLILTRSGIKRT